MEKDNAEMLALNNTEMVVLVGVRHAEKLKRASTTEDSEEPAEYSTRRRKHYVVKSPDQSNTRRKMKLETWAHNAEGTAGSRKRDSASWDPERLASTGN